MPEDAALIAVLLLDRPMCRDCISAKSGVSAVEIDRYLTIISRSLELCRQDAERCRTCGATAAVFSLQSSLA